jgi:hypothetical protein
MLFRTWSQYHLARSFSFIAVPSSSIHDLFQLREHAYSTEVLFLSSPESWNRFGIGEHHRFGNGFSFGFGFTAASISVSSPSRFVEPFGEHHRF